MTREEFITLAVTHEKALRRFLMVRAAATPRLPTTSRKKLSSKPISLTTHSPISINSNLGSTVLLSISS